MVKRRKSNTKTGEFFKFVIDNLPSGVLTVNAELRITGFNLWAEKVTGYSKTEAIGRFCGEILRGGMCDAHCPLRRALGSKKPVSLVETTIRNKRGETIPVRMNTAGLFDDDGQLVGGVESFQDISRLKTLEREKDNLVSMFAHDLKSSVAIIGGFAHRLIARREDMSQEKREEYLEIVRNQSEKLEWLIDEFLEFSRLQTGKIKPNLSPTSLDKELIEIVHTYEPKASEKGVKLNLENEEVLPIILADANKLRRVFNNLLDNALKYSKGKKTITVATGQTPAEVVVQVRDEGVGISSDELPYVFDAFHRGRNTHDTGGYGLGLAGVKSIVEAHGGHVYVESKAGQGSVFTVLLPKALETDSLGL
jgi:two-component system, OmpR family, phosphate regulon sensor histidine kinase PhoR